MNPPQITPFVLNDLHLLIRSPSLQKLKPFFQLLQDALKKQQKNKPFAAVVHLPYRNNAWANHDVGFEWPQDNSELSYFRETSGPMVGLVTKRVMEVYETSDSGRKKTTTILAPGMFFGLFEAFAQWPGDWTIASGVVSFMVMNAIGSAETWKRTNLSFKHKAYPRHFKFETDSCLSFEYLALDDICPKWSSQSVWIKPAAIQNKDLRIAVEHFLLQATIKQLRSVIKETVSFGRIGEAGTPSEASLWWEYVDSVIGGYTPIFQLVDLDKEECFPVSDVVGVLDKYRAKARGKLDNERWEILVPKQLDSGHRGIHLPSYLPRVPRGAETYFDVLPDKTDKLGTKHNRKIEKVSAKGFEAVEYACDIGRAKISSIVRPANEKKEEKLENSANHNTADLALKKGMKRSDVPNPLYLLANSNRVYPNWPEIFRTVVIIEKLA